jgi:outer membrane receptor protein involved in Fe transport
VDRDIFGYDDPPEVFDLYDVRDLDLYGIRQDWEFDLADQHYLRAGFEARSYDVRYDYESSSVIEDPIDDPRFEPGTRITSFHDEFDGEWYAVYVSDRVRFADRFTAELGVRYDEQTLTDNTQFSPRFNLLVNVGASGVLRLGWGHFCQSQRPYELDVPFGETQFFEAQKAEHWTAGFETDLNSHLSLRVDSYLREINDPHPRWETLFDSFHPVPELATDLVRLAPESVTAKGVETYLASRAGGRFDWWLSYTWSEITDEIPQEGDVPRFNDQTHAFTASATWRPGPKWSLTGVWTYHTGWPTTAVSASLVPAPGGDYQLSYDIGPFYQENHPDYYRLDFRASRTSKAGKGLLTLFIDVQNLFNRDNLRGLGIADPEYHYNSTTGGYRISFPEEYWLPIIPSFGVSWEF